MKIQRSDLEFEAGNLVKVKGQRPNYMSGDQLISLVRELGRLLLEAEKKA